jgi:xylulokinase
MSGHVIGIDLGTGGPRVALATERGELLGHETAMVDLVLLPEGGAEQDPGQWWSAIAGATRRLMTRGLVPVESVTAICVSAQWGGLVPVDASGHHLRNAQIWMDGRGAAYSRALTGGRLAVPGSGYDARGLREWIRKTGGVPTRTGKDPVGMTHWLRQTHPDVYAASAYLLDVPEYLTMRLTGRPVAGFDTAVLRWCTDNRDPAALRYDEPLIRRAGLDLAKLPELVPSASVVGTLLPEVADELGLHPGVRVVTGTSDSIAAAVGAGATEHYRGHIYIGTSAWLSCHVPFKRTDVFRNVASLPAAVPDSYWVATVQDVAGKAIDWLVHQVVYAEDGMLDGHPAPVDALDRVNALAMTSPPGSNGVVFAPWLNGERTPVDNPHIRGGWFNVSLSTTRADLARSVFEGIALNVRWMKEAVERFLGGERFTELRFIGGGATSPLWCQTLADVLGCTIHQVEEPTLANVRGAALYAAVGAGLLDWSEVPSLVRVARSFEPDPACRAVYDRQYATFVRLYRTTHRLYARHNRAAGPGRSGLLSRSVRTSISSKRAAGSSSGAPTRDRTRRIL